MNLLKLSLAFAVLAIQTTASAQEAQTFHNECEDYVAFNMASQKLYREELVRAGMVMNGTGDPDPANLTFDKVVTETRKTKVTASREMKSICTCASKYLGTELNDADKYNLMTAKRYVEYQKVAKVSKMTDRLSNMFTDIATQMPAPTPEQEATIDDAVLTCAVEYKKNPFNPSFY